MGMDAQGKVVPEAPLGIPQKLNCPEREAQLSNNDSTDIWECLALVGAGASTLYALRHSIFTGKEIG